MDAPFLSIVTRCFRRPNSLRKCIRSVKAQTDQDYEHVFIIDRKGFGRLAADQNLHKFKELCHGRYVMVLDDDDMITDKSFIAEVKQAALQHFPDVIVWRGIIHPYGEKDPLPRMNGNWGVRPEHCGIGSFCFCVSNEIYQRHIVKFDCNDVSDYNFIKDVHENGYRWHWIKKVYVRTQKKSYGRPE